MNSFSLRSIAHSLGLEVHMIEGRMQIRELRPVDRRPLWAQRLSSRSSFCRAVVQSGLLTHRQMVRAALRYRLGRSKDDAVIYWQIDQRGRVHDGKLMWYGPDCHRLKHRNATWVVWLLKRHYGVEENVCRPVHVFFGLHLLANTDHTNNTDYLMSRRTEGAASVIQARLRMTESRLRKTKSNRRERRNNFQFSILNFQFPTVCIVEAEKSAVILSELYPQYIWLAAGGMNELQPYKFQPLKHYKVILFPDTDPHLTAYTNWYNAAQQVMRSFFWPRDNPIYVSDFLERCASAEQKARKIDLVDFLAELGQ